MAKVSILSEHANMPRIMLNVESVGLTSKQFVQFCRDNLEMRIELPAQKEIVNTSQMVDAFVFFCIRDNDTFGSIGRIESLNSSINPHLCQGIRSYRVLY